MVDRDLAGALRRALRGDASAIAEISMADHSSLRAAETSIGAPLVVRRAAAVSVLRGLIDGRVSPPAAQAWASFMRRGFVEAVVDGPTQPIDVEFEAAWEDAISATISRLDEIGDMIDGEVTTGEALDLLQLLGQP
jgi:hypothetical protein